MEKKYQWKKTYKEKAFICFVKKYQKKKIKEFTYI